MKSFNILAVSIFLYFQSEICFGQNALNWTSYTENVNLGLTLIFSHPDNTKVYSDENSRCILTKSNKANLNWCIWMSDESDISVIQSIAEEKTFFKGQPSIQTDSILIDNIKCLCNPPLIRTVLN